MQLHALADGEVAPSPAVGLCEVGQPHQLPVGDRPSRDANPEHEVAGMFLAANAVGLQTIVVFRRQGPGPLLPQPVKIDPQPFLFDLLQVERLERPRSCFCGDFSATIAVAGPLAGVFVASPRRSSTN